MAKRKPIPYWIHDLVETARLQANAIEKATTKLILNPSDVRSAIEAHGAAVAIVLALGLLLEKDEDSNDPESARIVTERRSA